MLPVSGADGAEHLRCAGVSADDLVEQAQLELAEAGPAELLVEEDRPQALVLDLLLELADVGLHRGIGRRAPRAGTRGRAARPSPCRTA